MILSKLALTIFFELDDLKKIYDWDEFQICLKVLKNTVSKNPLVSFNENEKTVFIHKTYAEFLAGVWLSINAKKQIRNEHPLDIKELVKKLYFTRIYQC